MELTLWSILGVSLAWFALCIVLKATVRVRDPKSWHYRWIKMLFDVPTGSCEYFGKLMFMPHLSVVAALFLCAAGIVLCLGALVRFINDWVMLPFLFGKYRTGACDEKSLWGYRRVSNPFTPKYWRDIAQNMRPSGYGSEKFLPVAPLLVFLGVAYLWFFAKSGIHTWDGSASTGEWWFTVITVSTVVFGGLLIFVVKRIPVSDLWDALTEKVCFELKDPPVSGDDGGQPLFDDEIAPGFGPSKRNGEDFYKDGFRNATR